jgi:hypothetical protein
MTLTLVKFKKKLILSLLIFKNQWEEKVIYFNHLKLLSTEHTMKKIILEINLKFNKGNK